MKTRRISDETHRKLTVIFGTLMVQTSKMQTYQDAINALLNESVMLPPEVPDSDSEFHRGKQA